MNGSNEPKIDTGEEGRSWLGEPNNLGVFKFGEFKADSSERILSRAGEPISVTPKVFDTLLTFLRRPGVILTKEELLETIWQGRFVEESNLVQTVAMLRRAVGDGVNENRFIATVPGRGYRFVADVVRAESDREGDTSRMAPEESDGVSAADKRLSLGGKPASRILFCGFYELSKKTGYLRKNSLSRELEIEFFGAFENCFRNHGVQKYHRVDVRSCKTSPFIYRWCDRNRFSRFLSFSSKKVLGVVSGTVDEQGIQALEAKLNDSLNVRNREAEDQISRLVTTVNRFELTPEQRARYLGTVWAALWCQSFCNDISSQGDWQAAHRLAAESRRMIETALHGVASTPSQKRALALLTKCYCQTHAFQ